MYTDIEIKFMKSMIKQEFAKINIELNDIQTEQFYTYYEMLVETNKVMNLTAITEFEDVLQKHFIDSIIGTQNVMKNVSSVIDVGTGAGFPGIPLKIVYPYIKLTLLDSLNKRLNFLNDVIDKLGLKDVKTVHYRAEDGARDPKLREKFDCAVSRAVANLSTLCEYCIPYVRLGGMFLAYKSVNYKEEELQAEKAIKILGGRMKENIITTLPDSDIQRCIICIKKKEPTGKKYPRKSGMPSKSPLC